MLSDTVVSARLEHTSSSDNNLVITVKSVQDDHSTKTTNAESAQANPHTVVTV